MTKTGNELHPEDRAHVLRSYVHRMTEENIRAYPEHARQMREGGYRMPIRTDAEWLANTEFRVRQDGRLDQRVRSCRTNF
jgi:hypothetical protein